jgi:hypothetical protein
MKMGGLKLLTGIVLFILSVQGCTMQTNSAEIEIPLVNPSFEINGAPSLQGWTYNDCCPQLHGFSTDVPPHGGQFSVSIDFAGGPYWIYAILPVSAGLNSYTFSAWAKYWGLRGHLWIARKHGNEIDIIRTVTIADTSWRQYFVTTPVILGIGDSLVVGLDGGSEQLVGGTSYFDLCKLVQKDVRAWPF